MTARPRGTGDRQGYDDAHTPNLPLLVQYADAGARFQGWHSGRHVRRALPQLNINAVDQRKASTTGLWGELADTTKRAGGVTKIWLNRKMRASLDESVAQIGAPAAWQAGVHRQRGAGRGARYGHRYRPPRSGRQSRREPGLL